MMNHGIYQKYPKIMTFFETLEKYGNTMKHVDEP